MARQLNLLTAKGVEGEKRPGTYRDGGGLFLLVTKAGVKRWAFRYKGRNTTKSGKYRLMREMGLGVFPDVTLATARDKATEARKQLDKGIDPIEARREERKRAAGTTFGQVAEKLHEARKEGWRNVKHRAQWLSSLKTHAKAIWDRPVDAITASDIVTVLRPIWTTHSETASRVRGRIEHVLDAARVDGNIPEDRANPARLKGNLIHMLPPRERLQRGHHPALPYVEIPAFVARLSNREAMAALCLRFVILTVARSGEARGATWLEIDREKRVWVVPAERMKNKKPHTVHLSDAAIAVLDRVQPLATKPSDFIFPGDKAGKPLSDMALTMILRAMGINAVPHGFRSSFRDWSTEETTHPWEIGEMCLSHTVGSKVQRAYLRSLMLVKRRDLLNLWGAYCSGQSAKGSNVLPMRKAADTA